MDQQFRIFMKASSFGCWKHPDRWWWCCCCFALQCPRLRGSSHLRGIKRRGCYGSDTDISGDTRAVLSRAARAFLVCVVTPVG